MWRPPDWKNTSYDCSVCDTEPEGCPGCGNSAYEAGADAMLEAQKEDALTTYVDYTKLITSTLPLAGKKGWLVLIEDTNED